MKSCQLHLQKRPLSKQLQIVKRAYYHLSFAWRLLINCSLFRNYKLLREFVFDVYEFVCTLNGITNAHGNYTHFKYYFRRT